MGVERTIEISQAWKPCLSEGGGGRKDVGVDELKTSRKTQGLNGLFQYLSCNSFPTYNSVSAT